MLLSGAAATGCDRPPPPRVCLHVQCERCGHWMSKAKASGHRLCLSCCHAPAAAAAAASASSAPSSSASMFGRPSGCIDQLTLVERAAIVTLHGVGWTGCDIAQELHCDEHAVTRWVHRWQETRSLEDGERSGRPRCTTDDTDQDIMQYADTHVDDNPRDIVRQLELPVDRRTVRRRLNEIDLHSCVKRAEYENVRARLAFAEGYSRWTEDDWSHVLFSDETDSVTSATWV